MGVTLQPEFNAQAYYGNDAAGKAEFAASFCEFLLSRLRGPTCANLVSPFSVLLDVHGPCDLLLLHRIPANECRLCPCVLIH